MPFPADPGKDSRFIGRAGSGIGSSTAGNRSFVNVTAAEPTRVGRLKPRQSGNPCRPKRLEEPAVGSRPAAFCENLPLLVLPGWGARTNRVRNKFGRAPRAISVGHQQVQRPQVLATRISPDRIASRDCHTQSFAVVAPASRSQLGMWHSFIASGLYSAEVAPAAQHRLCAHRCHGELAILRLARLR